MSRKKEKPAEAGIKFLVVAGVDMANIYLQYGFWFLNSEYEDGRFNILLGRDRAMDEKEQSELERMLSDL